MFILSCCVFVICAIIGIALYRESKIKSIGEYWAKMNVAQYICDTKINGSGTVVAVCYHISYDLHDNTYIVTYVDKTNGDHIEGMSASYRMRSLRKVLEKDNKDPDVFLNDLRVKKLGK